MATPAGDNEEVSKKVAALRAQAQKLLGITDEEIAPLSVSHFARQTKTTEEAQVLFDKHTAKRKDLLETIRKKAEELGEEKAPQVKRSNTAIVAEMEASRASAQAQHTTEESKILLRRMAIQKLREARQQQARREQVAKTEARMQQARERAAAAEEAARAAIKTRTYTAKQGPPKPVKTGPTLDEALARAEKQREEVRRRYAERGQAVTVAAAQGHERSVRQSEEHIKQAEKRLAATTARLEAVPKLRAEREAELKKKGEERDKDAGKKKQTVQSKEVQRVEELRKAMLEREARLEAARAKAAEEEEAKRGKTKEELDARLKKADETVAERQKARAEQEAKVRERLAAVQERLAALEAKKRAAVFERSVQDAEKMAAVRRAARARDAEAQRELDRRAAFARGAAAGSQAKQAELEIVKGRVRADFDRKRAVLDEINWELDDATLRKELQQRLGVSETEAAEIIRVSKEPVGAPPPPAAGDGAATKR